MKLLTSLGPQSLDIYLLYLLRTHADMLLFPRLTSLMKADATTAGPPRHAATDP